MRRQPLKKKIGTSFRKVRDDDSKIRTSFRKVRDDDSKIRTSFRKVRDDDSKKTLTAMRAAKIVVDDISKESQAMPSTNGYSVGDSVN